MAAASFATYLETPRELRVLGFRAPPPSPVTGVLSNGGSGSPEYGECPDGNEDDEVGRFLRRSARVLVLRLPERAIPRKKKKKSDKAVWAPPVIDMRLLASLGGPAVEALRSAAVALGCFQVVGHGVNECLVSAAAGRASSPTPEEAGGEDGEELWWSPSEGDQLRCQLAHFIGRQLIKGLYMMLTPGFAVSRKGADDLFTQLEQTAAKLMDALRRDSVGATDSLAGADTNRSQLCIRTHHRRQCDGGSGSVGPITISEDDMLRMLIKSSRRPRALALHLCPGASTFHVFSRQRGWSRFRPLGGAVVVTVGDQLQAWSSGLYKSVAGKPAYSNDDLGADRGCDVVISAEYLHSCSSAGMENEPPDADAGKIIQLNVQIIVAACLVLLYGKNNIFDM
ncbi:hypothetical protein CFC21_042020 [Triticum aestivum]|uniref:Isopenicillin N synthase-like Fe(2+) 2OG dioxygenase domain-containing protein n=2 Tax=Triticum aestivum TaxID=4565 RepID=A0A9R1JUW0_WHEAT|nr:gibberellin 2-beta-dioxygenase 5-like isoform X1 [Triticum aestivum]KAF7030485.1 hypothetical protein CFC21_042020 [Triticum aestivum]CDM84046.1 unnamed protein product [Triticum aestivum]